MVIKKNNMPWQPPEGSIRLITPKFLLTKLAQHPLTRSLYPSAMGYYPSTGDLRVSDQTSNKYLLIYCSKGSGMVSLGEQQQRLRSGDLALLPPLQPHGYYSDPNDPWTIYWVNFEGELAEHFAERLQMKLSPFAASVGLQPRAIADFETLLEWHDKGYTATNVIHAVQLLQQLLSFFALQLRLHHPPGRHELDLEILEAIMMEYIHTDLSLDTLAKRSKLSKYYFSKKFRQLTGNSPIQHFIQMKIQHAAHRLQTSEQSVKQIAATLGYSDAYYFSRLFKKIIGQSPQQYRRNQAARRTAAPDDKRQR